MEPEDKEESTLSESQEFVEEFAESEAAKPAEQETAEADFAESEAAKPAEQETAEADFAPVEPLKADGELDSAFVKLRPGEDGQVLTANGFVDPEPAFAEEPIPDDLKIFDKAGNEIPLESLPEVDAEDVISSVPVEAPSEETPTVVKSFLAEIEEFRGRLRREALTLQPGPIAAAHFRLVDEALQHLAKALVKLGFSR